jgi:hypothetical protein
MPVHCGNSLSLELIEALVLTITEPQLGHEFTYHCDPQAKQLSNPGHFDEIASSLRFSQ